EIVPPNIVNLVFPGHGIGLFLPVAGVHSSGGKPVSIGPKAPKLHADGSGMTKENREEIAGKICLHFLILGIHIKLGHTNILSGKERMKFIDNFINTLNGCGRSTKVALHAYTIKRRIVIEQILDGLLVMILM